VLHSIGKKLHHATKATVSKARPEILQHFVACEVEGHRPESKNTQRQFILTLKP